jgi:VCBS repeat-containing protein
VWGFLEMPTIYVRDGADEPVNTTTADFQITPSVTWLADGLHYVVVWTSYNGTDQDVRGRVFNADGTPVADDFAIGANIGEELSPQVAALSDGRFVVVWTDSTAFVPQIFGQIFDATGAAVDLTPFLVSTPAFNTTASEPSVAAFATGGGFVVSWTEFNTEAGDARVLAQTFDNTGTSDLSPIVVNLENTLAQEQSSVAVLTDGNFVVVWKDDSAGTGTSDIRMTIFQPDGTPAGGRDVLVNATTSDGIQDFPTVTALASGGYVVAWTDNSPSGGDPSSSAIRARVFNSDGTTASLELLVNSSTTGPQYDVSIAALPSSDGGFVVSWTDGGGADTDIRAQRFGANGQAVGSEFLIAADTSGDQAESALAASPVDGHLIAVSTDYAGHLLGTDGEIERDSFTLDANGSLAIDDFSGSEGNVGNTVFSFTVTRTDGSTGAVDATWTISAPGGVGFADSADFALGQLLTGTVSFADGETSKVITINVAGDLLFEPNETFTVTLSNPTGGAIISDAEGVGTIVNDDAPAAPAVDLNGAAGGIDFAGAFTENGAGAPIGATIAVTAPNLPITGATITITDALAGDQLVVSGTLPATITVLSGAGTAQLVLTGTGTPADWEAALSLVRYTTPSDNPDAFGTDPARTITVQVSDAVNSSAAATATIAITAANDDPAVANLSGDILSFTEGDASVLLDAGGNAAVSDVDSANFAGGNLSFGIMLGALPEDKVFIQPGGNVTVTGSNVYVSLVQIGTIAAPAPGELLRIDFNANATPGAVQELVRAIAYTNTGGDNPAAGPRSIAYILTDGDGGATGGGVTVNVTAVNDAPVASVSDGLTATEQVALDLKGTMSVADGDAGALDVTISLLVTYGVLHVEAGTSGATIDAGNDSAAVTVTGTVAEINALLGSDATSVVRFTANTDNPPATAMLTLWVNDNGHSGAPPLALSSSDSTTIAITAVNDAPTLAGFGPSVTFLENTVNATPQLLDAGVSFSDPEDNLDGGTVTVSRLLAEDRVAIRNEGTDPGQISVSGANVSYGGTLIGTAAGGVGGTLTVTLNANATSAAVDALIQNLTYANVSDTPTATRTLIVNVTDSDGADFGPASVPATFAPLTGAANPFDGFDVGFYATPIFADLDNDGDLDAVVGQNDGLLVSFRNNGNGTYTDFGVLNPFAGMDFGTNSSPAFVDLDNDTDLDLVVGDTNGMLRAFENNAGTFSELVGGANPFLGFDVGDDANPVFADIDGDNDLDLVVGNNAGQVLTYRNAGGTYTLQVGPANPFDAVALGGRATPDFVDLDGDGDLDAVIGALDGQLRAYRNDAGVFTPLVGAANPFDTVDVGVTSSPSFVDLDGDGDMDAVVGEYEGALLTFENTTPPGEAIIVNVTAQNDAAAISGTTSGSVTEASGVANGTPGTPQANGNLDADDVDNPDDSWTAASGARTYGSYTLGTDGAWTYTLDDNNAAVQALNTASTPLTDTFTAVTVDGTQQVVTITINGANDAAVLSADVRELTETNSAVDISSSGTLTISDVDSPQTFVAQTNTGGTYGTFSVDSAGAWTYTASSAHNEFVDGIVYNEVFPVASADGTMTSVTIHITGTNDAAVLSADVRNLTETNSAVDISSSGTLTVSDVDSSATFVAQTNTAGTYGTFSVDSAGAWTYTASSAHNEFADGVVYTDTFPVSSADGTTTSVKINITGTNDAAILSADVRNLTETNSAVDISSSGTLTISDVDSSATFAPQTNTAGTYGTFSVDSAGAWTYTASTAHNEFVDGVVYTDTFPVSSADGTTTSVTINITGTNDAAVLSADVRELTETNSAVDISSSGTLTISDVDSSATFVAQTNTGGTYGTFSVNSAGAWTYTASGAHNEFVDGVVYNEVFPVASADGTMTSVTIHITGTNDAAILSADVRNLTETNSAVDISSSGTLTVSDIDSSATFAPQTNTAGSYGTFSVDAAGAWTYTASSAHDEFVDGVVYTDTFPVSSADGTTTSVTINITGTNDAAVLSADVRELTETNSAVDISSSGTLTISDVDSSATFVAQTNTGGTYGTFSVDSAGAWTYTASSAHNEFVDGIVYNEVFPVASADGTMTSVTIHITGTNDAAVLSADVRELTETNSAVDISSSGTLTISDVDSSATFVAQTNTGGTYGTFSVDSAGAWTYTASSAHNEFVDGVVYNEVFPVASADGTMTSVTIHITGTNDAAVLSADVRNLTETNSAVDISSSGTLTISDVDSSETFAPQTNTAGTYGTFSIDSAGAWSYTASSAHNEFVDGVVYTDTFPVSSADGTTTSVTINITGTNDAAILSADVRELTETNSAVDISSSGTLTISDVDSPQTFVAQTNTGGTYGTFSVDSAGAWTYTASSAHNEFVDGIVYNEVFPVASADGTMTSVTIHITGTNDAAILSADVRNLTETNAAVDIGSSGTLTISDVDSPATFVAQTDTIGTYGTFSIDAAGAWTYAASTAHNEFVHGVVYTDTFPVASADGTTTSVTINITGTNDAPVIGALDGNSVTYTEGDGSVGVDALANATVSDIDSANFDQGSLTVAITGALAEDVLRIDPGSSDISVSSGTLSYSGTPIGTVTGNGVGGSALVFAFNADATPAAVQALIHAIQYVNAGGDDPIAGTRTLTWTLVDGGGQALGGTDTVSVTSSVEVIAVNDPPSGVAHTLTFVEDIPHVFAAADFTYTDPENDGLFSVTITDLPGPGVGTIYYDADAGGGGFAPVAISPGQTFTLDDLNQGRLTYVPALNANGDNYASFTYQVRDDGGTDHGGADYDTSADTITIDLTAVNDAPTVTFAAGGIYTTLEQVALDLKGSILVGDVDSDSVSMSVTLSAGGVGILTVTAGGSGADVAGSGSGDVTITGTLAQIQALLVGDATSTILYTPNTDNPPASTSLGVLVNDNGGTGEGGPQFAIGGHTITITPVNDAPDGIDHHISAVENTPRTLAPNVFTFTDPEGNGLAEVTIVDLPTNGTIFYDADGPGGNAPVAVTTSTTFTVAQLSAFRVTYRAATDESGPDYDTFTYVVRDNGGILNGGQDTDPLKNTITIDVSGFNNSPQETGLNNDAVTFFEDTPAGVVFLDDGRDAVITDLDSTDFDGGTLLVHIVANEVATEDQLVLITDAEVTLAGNIVSVNGVPIGTFAGGGLGDDMLFTFNSGATPASVSRLIHNLSYVNTNTVAPDTDLRVVEFRLTDGDGSTMTAFTTISVVSVDDPATAGGDAATTDEATPVVIDVVTNDNDIDGPPPSVAAVNGTAISVGSPVTLPTGAIVSLNPDGTLSYDPNGAFDSTPTADSGAVNTPAPDGFSYTLAGNGGTASVSVTVTGLDTNDFLLSGVGGTLTGGVGNDTYVVDSGADVVVEEIGEGRDVVYTSANYVLAAGSEVEILSALSQAGTGALELTGNALGQEIYGNAGANFLDGGGGADYLAGLGGNDTYVVGTGAVISEAVGQGRDVAYARSDYTLAAGAEVEILSALSQSGTGALQLIGNALGQEIYGNAGANFLDGGGGADYLAGLGGNDTYVVETGAVVAEAIGGGRDVVYARTDYVLAAGAEVEILSVLSQAATTPLQLTGNEFVNEIYGNAGANFLDGGGGADYMAGAAGDDTYIVDNAGDVVAEAVGQGRDIVYARANYALTAGAAVEILTAISQAATTPLQLIGNAFAQEIYANDGNNFLDGGGGADYLRGFAGNDTYIVDSLDDVAFESIGGGTDVVYARSDHALAVNSEIEVLSAISQSATTALQLTGNEFAQAIYGNAGTNFLDGRGGADYLAGLGGNDTYVIDNGGDIVAEAIGGGRDVVYARANYVLTAGSEIEILSAFSSSGIGPLNLTGNEFANEIYGNIAANRLDGGAGADYLMGFAGADTFAFTTALGNGNVDFLADFAGVANDGEDVIALDHNVFTGLALGALNPNAFFAGSAAHDADDRILYDSATGNLFFDADGVGGVAAILFARVEPNSSLTAGDFTVI